MTRILLVGADPDGVDYSDPSLPKGLSAAKIKAGIEVALGAKIKAGIEVALGDFRKRGWDADHCLIDPT